jgi:hypothetical protein
MTFKSASERQSFTSRVASHSTKGHANGRVDVLPPEARPQAQLFNEADKQYNIAKLAHENVLVDMKAVKKKLKRTLPFDEFRRLSERLENLKALEENTRNTLSKYREIRKSADNEAFCSVFYRVAELRLEKVIFMELDQEAIREMGTRSLTKRQDVG